MKVLIHGINYAPELTGVGKYTGELACWLVAQGHEVRAVVAPPYYPAWRIGAGYRSWRYQREVMNGVDVWRTPLWIPSKLTGLRRALHLFSFALSSLPVMLWQVLWRPDLVLVLEPTLATVPQALLTARLAGAKAWMHVQDFEIDAAMKLGLVGNRRLAQGFYSIESWLMRRFDRVSTVSHSMLDALARKGVAREKSFLFLNWVDTELLHPLVSDQAFRQAHVIPAGKPVVLYAGNLGEKQGLEILLDAAERALSTLPEVLFLICGDGAARVRLADDAVRRGLANVRFLPLQSLENLPGLLAAAQVHLVLQKSGTGDMMMPSKLAGIMAMGGAAIVTADTASELHRLLAATGVGMTIPADDAEALFASIVKLLADEPLRRSMGAKARRYAVDQLGKEAVLREVVARFVPPKAAPTPLPPASDGPLVTP